MPEMSDEEVASLKAEAERAKQLETEKALVETKLKELEEDSTNINWKRAREVQKRLRSALESSGKKVDDDGNLIEVAPSISQDEIRRLAAEEAQRANINRAVGIAKNSLNDADKAIFDKFYAKAVHGENVDQDNIQTYIDIAMRMAQSAGGMSHRDYTYGVNGGAPRLSNEKNESFAQSDRGKDLLGKLGFNSK